MPARPDLFRVMPDDPGYLRAADAEAQYWNQPQPFGLESLEAVWGPSPVDRYQNARFTGDPEVPWYETIPRHGVFRRGLVLGTSAMRPEARILEVNPTLHATFVDISAGAVGRRGEVLGRRFPGRVDTRVADLNFVAFEPGAYDLVVSSASLHHVTNLEHLAFQINAALAPDGYFFLQDYVGEPRFQFAEAKKRVFTCVHDRAMVPRGRPPGVLWRDASDLSPFCGVRSDELLAVFRTHLAEVAVKTAETLTVALMRSLPPDGAVPAPPGVAQRARDVAQRWMCRLRGMLPPGKVPIPPELLRDLMVVGDVATDAAILLPGTAFAVYRKR
ncbi:MAG: class I SAM-dependent methyltransferase [Candidatus Binatia bacterium]